MGFTSITYMIFFIVGMYGLYQIKHGYKFKGLIKLVICLAVCSIVAGNSGGDNNSEKKSSQPKETKTVAEDWRTDFDDQMSIIHNMDLCKKSMLKMDSVAENAQKVSPADVMANPKNYMGKVLEMGATVSEAEDFPADSGGAKFFNGLGHVIIANADDGTIIMASRKGVVDEQKNQFTVVVGMLAGIQDLGETKALFIVGDPKN